MGGTIFAMAGERALKSGKRTCRGMHRWGQRVVGWWWMCEGRVGVSHVPQWAFVVVDKIVSKPYSGRNFQKSTHLLDDHRPHEPSSLPFHTALRLNTRTR